MVYKARNKQSLKIAAATANCGNDTIGVDSCHELVNLVSKPDGPDVLVINCQEVHHRRQQKQLMDEIASQPDVSVTASDLMVTRTKPTVGVLMGNTGIATFVVYKNNRVNSVIFKPDEVKEIRGNNRNKGGYVNTLTVTDTAGNTQTIKTISGHLDSGSEKKRAQDWKNIKQKSAFEAKNWAELVAKVPVMQVAGYDANTRDLWDATTKERHNMWHQQTLHPHIAPMALAPLGTELFSAENTYKRSKGEVGEDKRSGYARGGSLDFVAMQNNTQAASTPNGPNRYQESPMALKEEVEHTERDHDIITSSAITIETVSPFERVKHYMVSELMQAAPKLAQEISQLEHNGYNQELLVDLHQHYLSPGGALFKKITEAATNETDVQPWFENQTLKQFLVDRIDQHAQAIREAFEPKRFISADKKNYIGPNAEFETAFAAYRNNQTDPIAISNLYAALDSLESVTNDPHKNACITAMQQSLILASKASTSVLTSSFRKEIAHLRGDDEPEANRSSMGPK